MVPNPYYCKWRDLNGDLQIDQNEKYLTYLAAWQDYTGDPRQGSRTPGTWAYNAPRRARLAISFNF
jgi:hypothetical protein